MQDHRIEFKSELPKGDSLAWRNRMEEICDEHGHFERLNEEFSAYFVDAGPKLIVTFENDMRLQRVNQRNEPIGFSFINSHGWSHLTIYSAEQTWFRHDVIYRYFDRLTDDGFFEDFDDVLFVGAGQNGYAAAAFSIASPNAKVLAFSPQATLDPEIAGWDTRYISARKFNFRKRYGNAAEMIDGANNCTIIYDPDQRWDAIHAALFSGSNVQKIAYRALGGSPDATLAQFDLLDATIASAMDGTLDKKGFVAKLRTVRDHTMYLRIVLNAAQRRKHPQLAINICNYVLEKGENRFFAVRLEQLKKIVAARAAEQASLEERKAS